MTVVLTGSALTLDELVRVARDGEAVALVARRGRAHGALARSRSTPPSPAAIPVYGLTTGVGVLKRVPLAAGEVARFNRRLLENHRVAQGPPVAPELVRATMLRLANGFAAGHAGVRPALAERLVEALDRGVCPVVRELGSLGESDLAPLADLAAGLLRRSRPGRRRGSRPAQQQRLLDGRRGPRRAPMPAACSPPPTPPRRSASRPSPRTFPSCTRRSSPLGPTRASRSRSTTCASCSTAATCGARGRRVTCRTRSPSVPCPRCTARRATPSPTRSAGSPSS